MKLLKTPVLILAVLMCWAHAFSQNKDNPCGYYWGPWEPTPLSASGGVFYSVQHSKCTEYGMCGWPIIGLEHTFPFPVTIGITLRGIGCDNKEFEASFSTGGNEVPGNQEQKGSGNWHMFKRVDQVMKVEVHYHKDNDYYQITYDRATGRTITLINGKTPEEIEKEKREAEEQRKKDEADQKQREEKERKDKEEADKRKKEDNDRKKADDDKKKKDNNNSDKNGNGNGGGNGGGNNSHMPSKGEIYAQRKALDDQIRNTRLGEMTAFWMGDWMPMSFRDPGCAISLSEGLSVSQLPCIVDITQSDGAGTHSSTDNFFNVGFSNNIEIWPYRNDHFGIGAFGGLEYDWGLSEYGESHAMIANYGFRLLGGLDKIKLVGEYSNGYREVAGSIEATAWSGVTIDEVGSSLYDYGRVGLGLMGDFSDDESETSVTLMLYKDHLSFMPQGVTSYAYRLYVRWAVDFFIEYGNNYAVGGHANYAMDDKNHNQDYFLIGMVKNANIFASHYEH